MCPIIARMSAPNATTRMLAQDRPNGGIFTPRTFSRRTRQRFAVNRRRELVRHLAREPSYPERLIIERIIGIEWELRRLDARIDAGDELSGHAMRARLAAETRLRLDLRELGLRPASVGEPPGAALDRHLRTLTDRRGGAAA